MTTIQQAKQVLREKGYYVDNLWHVDDVLQTYDCTTEEAQSVLDAALSSDYIANNVFSWIDTYAENYGLTEKLEK